MTSLGLSSLPGAPRTETAAYGDPRAPFASALPAFPINDDAISDLVANCLSRSDDFGVLLGSRPHVRAVLERFAALELDHEAAVANLQISQRDLAIAQGLAAGFERELNATTQRYLDELAVTKRLLDKSADDSQQIAKLHRYATAERETAEAWQHHCAELMVANAKLKAENDELRDASIRRLCEIARLQELGDSPDVVVVDPHEWTSDPTPTGRDSATMAEIVGGGR